MTRNRKDFKPFKLPFRLHANIGLQPITPIRQVIRRTRIPTATFVVRSSGKRLPVGGRDYNALDLLLSPLVLWKQVGNNIYGERIVLRSTREQIARYWHLIEDTP